MYAILGIILPIFCRMSDRTVAIFATLLILQPIDWAKLIYALCNPDYVAGKSLAGYYFSIAFDVQKHGNFLETVRMNMWEGQMANMTWALEHGRILQTPGLFLFGMLVGRRKYFLYSEQNERLWLKALAISLLLLPHLRIEQYVAGIHRTECRPCSSTVDIKFIQQP